MSRETILEFHGQKCTVQATSLENGGWSSGPLPLAGLGGPAVCPGWRSRSMMKAGKVTLRMGNSTLCCRPVPPRLKVRGHQERRTHLRRKRRIIVTGDGGPGLTPHTCPERACRRVSRGWQIPRICTRLSGIFYLTRPRPSKPLSSLTGQGWPVLTAPPPMLCSAASVNLLNCKPDFLAAAKT